MEAGDMKAMREAESTRGRGRKVSRRKWVDSGVLILSVSGLLDSLNQCGGVWLSNINRFMNEAWVINQQLHTLTRHIVYRRFHYPKLNKEEA